MDHCLEGKKNPKNIYPIYMAISKQEGGMCVYV